MARARKPLAVPGTVAATYDGDTPIEARDAARRTGPTCSPTRTCSITRCFPDTTDGLPSCVDLRFVVVDECHCYRGVFGSHVAQVLRRLRRVAADYGAKPVFVLASATTAEPEVSAGRLVGQQVVPGSTDGSPRGSGRVRAVGAPAVYRHMPCAGENGAPVRRSTVAETAGSARRPGGSRCPNGRLRSVPTLGGNGARR